MPRILDDPRIRTTVVDDSLAQQPRDSGAFQDRVNSLIEWDPESDVSPPEDHFAEIYVPTSERVPPMPPVQERPPQAEAVQFKTINQPGGQALNLELGFPAHSVIVDNLTNQWLFFTSARRWVAPYSYGAIISFMQSTQVANYLCAAPPGGFTLAAPIPAETVQTTWLAMFNAPSTGTIVTKA